MGFSVSTLFSTFSKSSRKFFMLYMTTSIHSFLCFFLFCCPRTFISRMRLKQSSSFRRCTCPNHLSLAYRTLFVILRRCNGYHHPISFISTVMLTAVTPCAVCVRYFEGPSASVSHYKTYLLNAKLTLISILTLI